MKSPRFTDARNFRLPYADVATTNRPGYLARRFRAYLELARTEREAAHQDRLAKIVRMK